jgi:hypothetical protein
MKPPRYIRAVPLRSGGQVTLSIEARTSELSPADSRLLLTLIETLDQYQAGAKKTKEVKNV